VSDVVGYDVEATDGHIGKIDHAPKKPIAIQWSTTPVWDLRQQRAIPKDRSNRDSPSSARHLSRRTCYAPKQSEACSPTHRLAGVSDRYREFPRLRRRYLGRKVFAALLSRLCRVSRRSTKGIEANLLGGAGHVDAIRSVP
jgi:hypothetical protein